MKINIIILILLFSFNAAVAVNLLVKEIGPTELEIEFELLYFPINWHFNITTQTIPKVSPDNEIEFYTEVISGFIPRFISLEVGVYPMSLVGLGVKAILPGFYSAMAILPGLNLVEGLTTPYFPQPYNVSLFIGSLADFVPSGGGLDSYEGKGYSGLFVAYGSHHIRKNEIILDNWIDISYKLKGKRTNLDGLFIFNYEIGLKIHTHNEIKSYFYITLKRENFDTSLFQFKLFENSFFEYKIKMDIMDWKVISASLIYGKSFPVKGSRVGLGLFAGVLWNVNDLYSGSLVIDDLQEWIFIISPLIYF